MPKRLKEPARGRCKNCRKAYDKHHPDQKYCSTKCRNQLNNYGKTPQAQMEGRLKAYMKTDQFREMVREEVRRLLKTSEPGIEVIEVVALPIKK